MAEFKQKLKALHTQLDEGEMQSLFQHLDKANRGFIDYQSFVTEFPEINSKLNLSLTHLVSYMIRRIKRII